MIVTKKALPRRTVLRGIGATVALPFLDAMAPALTATARTAAAPVPRLGFIYAPNGMFLPNFHPSGDGGRGYTISRFSNRSRRIATRWWSSAGSATTAS